MLKDVYEPAYTKFYETFCDDNSNFRDDFKSAMVDSGGVWDADHRDMLDSVIYNKFYMYEVFVDNYTVFLNAMVSIFKIHAQYYSDLLEAYEAQINVMDGKKVTTTYTPRSKYESRTYDLPRSESSIDRPSSKATNGGIDGTDTTVTTDVNALEQKKRYMALARNVYDEFASKFVSCFIEMFDYKMKEAA